MCCILFLQSLRPVEDIPLPVFDLRPQPGKSTRAWRQQSCLFCKAVRQQVLFQIAKKKFKDLQWKKKMVSVSHLKGK
jgi:hypothetical protein